jgi:hypothetical protein
MAAISAWISVSVLSGAEETGVPALAFSWSVGAGAEREDLDFDFVGWKI